MEQVRERARRLLEIHPLRAADSLQLGAALLTSEETPQGFPFVTLDLRLGDAAEKEGFHVIKSDGSGPAFCMLAPLHAALSFDFRLFVIG